MFLKGHLQKSFSAPEQKKLAMANLEDNIHKNWEKHYSNYLTEDIDTCLKNTIVFNVTCQRRYRKPMNAVKRTKQVGWVVSGGNYM